MGSHPLFRCLSDVITYTKIVCCRPNCNTGSSSSGLLHPIIHRHFVYTVIVSFYYFSYFALKQIRNKRINKTYRNILHNHENEQLFNVKYLFLTQVILFSLYIYTLLFILFLFALVTTNQIFLSTILYRPMFILYNQSTTVDGEAYTRPLYILLLLLL